MKICVYRIVHEQAFTNRMPLLSKSTGIVKDHENFNRGKIQLGNTTSDFYRNHWWNFPTQ